MAVPPINKFAIAPLLLPIFGCSPVFIASEHDLPLPLCSEAVSQPCIESAKVHSTPQAVVSDDLPDGKIAAGIFSSAEHSNQRPKIGLALAGGGSKSAPFAMGAIKRFVDENWLKQVDYISSVSGGGYAVFYLYDKAIRQIQQQNTCSSNDQNCLRDYFFDARLECYADNCKNTLTYLTADYLQRSHLGRSRTCDDFHHDINGHQEWLECYQDLLSSFPGGISENGPLTYLKMVPETIFEIGATAAMLPVHYLANGVFDWRMKLAPTQWAYESGIYRTYGYEPETGKPDKNWLVEFMPDLQNRSFQELESVYQQNVAQFIGHPMPIWIMNATTPDNGTWLNRIFSDSPYDLDQNIFEIGPFHFGAGIFDYVHGSPSTVGLDIPTAVAASAAFFDASKRDVALPAGIYALLFASNLSWGLDIPNYNRSTLSRVGHNLLPWPLYYLQGNFENDDRKHNVIHLSDGGQSGDNLGFVSLLRRNVENIILFDGAQDKGGNKDLSSLTELCVANRFLNGKGYKLVFEGAPDQDDNAPFDLNQECNMDKLTLYRGVDPYHWRKPIWRGYVVPKASCSLPKSTDRTGTPTAEQYGQYVYYVKSALDREAWQNFSKEQLQAKQHGGVCKANQEDPNYYCPLAWYFNDFDYDPNFPQDSTVFTTFNSNAKRFKAYRDLGWFLAGKLRQQPQLQPFLK